MRLLIVFFWIETIFLNVKKSFEKNGVRFLSEMRIQLEFFWYFGFIVNTSANYISF